MASWHFILTYCLGAHRPRHRCLPCRYSLWISSPDLVSRILTQRAKTIADPVSQRPSFAHGDATSTHCRGCLECYNKNRYRTIREQISFSSRSTEEWRLPGFKHPVQCSQTSRALELTVIDSSLPSHNPSHSSVAIKKANVYDSLYNTTYMRRTGH
jgi:hypothetical protein